MEPQKDSRNVTILLMLRCNPAGSPNHLIFIGLVVNLIQGGIEMVLKSLKFELLKPVDTLETTCLALQLHFDILATFDFQQIKNSD